MDKRKKRLRISKPPPRLAWGGGGAIGEVAKLQYRNKQSKQIKQSNRKSLPSGKTKSRKRARTSSSSSSSSPSPNLSWTEKYKPTNSKDLCVAPRKIEEFKQFIQPEGDGGGLCVLVGSPGIGKSTMVHVLGEELGMEVKEWTEGAQAGSYVAGLNLEQSTPFNSFADFIRQSSFSLSGKKCIVLIDETPHLHDDNAHQRFRDIIANHIQASPHPTVMIFSQTREGKHQPSDLERMVDSDLLYKSGRSQIIQIHPVTKAKLKKICSAICKAEKVASPDDWDWFQHSTQGDLRHAIHSLQFSSAAVQERDISLSAFHALGKLLYAKRKTTTNDSINNKRGPLLFDPEGVMETMGMEITGGLTFLEGNGMEFFTDVQDWSNACLCFSDAALFLGQSNNSDSYAASLASRAVAACNHHPAPRKFRPLTAPRIYEVRRKSRENHNQMRLLTKRLSLQHRTGFDINIGNGSFVTETLPYIQHIVPHDVHAAMNNMYSVVRNPLSSSGDKTQEEIHQEQIASEQRLILAEDDILEDDDDWGDEKMIRTVPVKVTQSEGEEQKATD